MGAQGFSSLVPAITANTRLVTLNNLKIQQAGISANSMRVRDLTDPGYEMVFVSARLRAQAHELTYLDLADNSLGFAGARLLYTALLECKNLEELDIRSNSLRSAGVVIVAGAFPELVKLTSLDLSFNLINTLKSNSDVAEALQNLPQLTTLKYLGNIDKEIGFNVCCCGNKSGSYQILQRAIPKTAIMVMTPAQARIGVLSWILVFGGLIIFIALSTISIVMYNDLEYNELGYALAVGTAAILVLVGLLLLIWVLYRHVFARLGTTHLIASALYRRRRLQSVTGRASPNETENGLVNNHLVEFSRDFPGLSERDREHANRILNMEDTHAGFGARQSDFVIPRHTRKTRLQLLSSSQTRLLNLQ